MTELPGDDKNRQHISLEQVKAAIDSGLITESVVLDTYASYKAMREERDEAQDLLQRSCEQRAALRDQLIEAHEALKLFAPGSHDGVWGTIKAQIVNGAASRDEGIRLARQITEWQCVVDAALSASPTGENSKSTTIMRAADQSALSGGQDFREVPDTKGSQRIAICERCQMRLPERLVTFGVGVRGGTAARCAACAPQPGPDGEANRAEVIAIRKGMRA